MSGQPAYLPPTAPKLSCIFVVMIRVPVKQSRLLAATL
jgi:hypothetical protein